MLPICYAVVANLLLTCYGETGVMDLGLHHARTHGRCSCGVDELVLSLEHFSDSLCIILCPLVTNF